MVEALQAREPLAFRELMAMYYPVLVRFAADLTDDSPMAEDIAEEAFIQLWNRLPSFGTLMAIRKFLWVAARNDSFDTLRKRKRQKQHQHRIAIAVEEVDERTILNKMIRAEVLADIYSAIRELPEKMQRVFTYSYIEGLRNQEIADRLNISEQTVRNQKSKALEILRLRLADIDPVSLLCLLVFLK